MMKHGADLLAGLVTSQGTHAGTVLGYLQPVARTYVGEVQRGQFPGNGTPGLNKGRKDSCAAHGAADGETGCAPVAHAGL